MKSSLWSERGSATLENLGSLLALAMILTGGFFILYASFARVWIDRQGYEAYVCLASTARERECEHALRKRVLFALPIGDLHDVQLSRTRYNAVVKLNFEILSQRWIRYEETHRLPLLESLGEEGIRRSFR